MHYTGLNIMDFGGDFRVFCVYFVYILPLFRLMRRMTNIDDFTDKMEGKSIEVFYGSALKRLLACTKRTIRNILFMSVRRK